MALPENPITRKEAYLAKIAGQEVQIPDVPITREEAYLDEIAKNGGGGGGYVLPTATASRLGGVKIGSGINVEEDGTISASGGGGGTDDYNDLDNQPQINGVTLSGNKTTSDLGISIPTNLADLDDDSTHRTVTDAEKSIWNNKSDFSGAYADLTGLPTLGTASSKDVPTAGDASSSQVVLGSDSRLTDSRPASDVSSWAKQSTKPTYTASEVGAIATTEKGVASGVAELDSNGKVPSNQLPSYVDDVLSYASQSAFPATGETGKIYIAEDTNKTYRWSGSVYAEISESLALGETSSTAYRGDRGKVAYDHSQTSGNPHGTTAADVGLSNVPNVATNDQTPTFTEASTRNNIASGDKLSVIMGKIQKFFNDLKTVAFSGSYADLTNKPENANTFQGTIAEWNQLATAKKKAYDHASLTGTGGGEYNVDKSTGGLVQTSEDSSDTLSNTTYLYNNASIIKKGNVVMVSWKGFKGLTNQLTNTISGLIPQKYRPSIELTFDLCPPSTATVLDIYRIKIKTNGDVTIYPYNGVSAQNNLETTIIYLI